MTCLITDCAMLQYCTKYLSENNESIVLIGTVVGGALLLLGAVLYFYARIHSTTFWTVSVGGAAILGGATLFGLIGY